MQKRAKDFTPMAADINAVYDERIDIDLSKLKPLIALPHSPDNVQNVSEVAGIAVQQVAIGSCTNSSLADMMMVAKVLKGKKINPAVSLVISPGSRQVVTMLAKNGALADMITAGARILENACGPCIGMGQAPSSGAVSLRTFNRNFEGRSGTKDAQVYLCSPEVAVASAMAGKITDPIKLGKKPSIKLPASFLVDKKLIIMPPKNPASVNITRGPNIAPLPKFPPMENGLSAAVMLKVGDNITTDHIMPAGAKILPLRSNLPAISEYCFNAVDKDFVKRAKAGGSGIIVAGENYGQGSSREHAALAPRYLGIRAVIAKSFARIHLANLINFGILPLTFSDPADYDKISIGNILEIGNVAEIFASNNNELAVKSGSIAIKAVFDLTDRQKAILLAGGLLNWIKGA
jgi:aconitate hydratase